jgi:hypothetical protein
MEGEQQAGLVASPVGWAHNVCAIRQSLARQPVSDNRSSVITDKGDIWVGGICLVRAGDEEARRGGELWAWLLRGLLGQDLICYCS